MSEIEHTEGRDVTRRQLLSKLLKLRSKFERVGVRHLTLFGSRARGDFRTDSDVDLVVDVDPSRKFSLVELSRLHLIAEDELQLRANIVVQKGLKTGLASAIARDGVSVF
jgi:predicted nucleotidyltransferase